MRKSFWLHPLLLSLIPLLVVTPASQAQWQNPVTIARLITGAKFIGAELSRYLAGKGFDKLLGLDQAQQLKELENNILMELKKKNGEEAQRLRTELELTRSQLNKLNVLLATNPPRHEVEKLKQQSDTELNRLLQMQQQDRKLLQENSQKIMGLEKKMEDISVRVDRLERLEPRSSSGSEDYREDWTRPNSDVGVSPSPRRQVPGDRRGATLTLTVTGHSNSLRVEEVESSRFADLGAYEIDGYDRRHTLQLLAGTGAVLTIKGDDNIIHLPSNLCSRVRVRNQGRGNRVIGCP